MPQVLPASASHIPFCFVTLIHLTLAFLPSHPHPLPHPRALSTIRTYLLTGVVFLLDVYFIRPHMSNQHLSQYLIQCVCAKLFLWDV